MLNATLSFWKFGALCDLAVPLVFDHRFEQADFRFRVSSATRPAGYVREGRPATRGGRAAARCRTSPFPFPAGRKTSRTSRRRRAFRRPCDQSNPTPSRFGQKHSHAADAHDDPQRAHHRDFSNSQRDVQASSRSCCARRSATIRELGTLLFLQPLQDFHFAIGLGERLPAQLELLGDAAAAVRRPRGHSPRVECCGNAGWPRRRP